MSSPCFVGYRYLRRSVLAIMALLLALLTLAAGPTPRAGAAPVLDVTVERDIAYTDPVPFYTLGNLLDLYVPELPGNQEMPLIIWTSGSAWFSDQGKEGAEDIAAIFNQYGYAVAGVSVRASWQVQFPGQLFDIRAAIRWLRDHAADYNLDPTRIAIMGNSSGGWATAIAATTGDIYRLDGEPDPGGTSSAVQAAVPFFPPTDFLQMNAWYDAHPGVFSFIDHDAPDSPESLLVGCPIQTCPAEAKAADPITYVGGDEPPMMVFHGTVDPLVPNGQSVLLYNALATAGNEVVFTSVDGAGHSVSVPDPFLGNPIIGADEFTVYATNPGGHETVGDSPAPTWENIEHFIHVALSRARR